MERVTHESWTATEAVLRARTVEEARVDALILAARQEGRGPEPEEEARAAEMERAVAHLQSVASAVAEEGTVLSFTFWAENGALTLLDYRNERGSRRPAQPVDGQELGRLLRLVLNRYAGQRIGQMALRLKREERRWALDYEAPGATSRPPEARGLPVRVRTIPGATFLALHDEAKRWLGTVQVPERGALTVEYLVRLEDGRLTGWELLTQQMTRGGRGGRPRVLGREAEAEVTRILLPFTEGLGKREVRLVVEAEHRTQEQEASGRVASARVERTRAGPELSWYRAMHEATLLRWREGVHEGSAWLAQKGVEEMALWFAGGMAAHGASILANQGLKLVPRALGHSPEAAAGWLRSTWARLSGEDKKSFARLWQKVQLQGEKSLSHEERHALRALMKRIEQLIVMPLDGRQKNNLRQAAREYYKKLYPQFESILDKQGPLYPIHHQCPLEYAHLFPDKDINAASNLAMVQSHVHKRLNALWSKIRATSPNANAAEVEKAARIIDEKFNPWYHQLKDPPGHSLDIAESAALSELQRLFPGLK